MDSKPIHFEPWEQAGGTRIKCTVLFDLFYVMSLSKLFFSFSRMYLLGNVWELTNSKESRYLDKKETALRIWIENHTFCVSFCLAFLFSSRVRGRHPLCNALSLSAHLSIYLSPALSPLFNSIIKPSLCAQFSLSPNLLQNSALFELNGTTWPWNWERFSDRESAYPYRIDRGNDSRRQIKNSFLS